MSDGGRRRLHLLHLHSTFGAGGKERRSVALINRFGPAIDHSIVSAEPGAMGAMAHIAKGISAHSPFGFPRLAGRFGVRRLQTLARAMRGALRGRGHDLGGGPMPMVISDVWYLNDDQLRLQPTVSIGDPSVNAASAMLAGKLPCGFAIENACQLLIDPELLDARACLWGVDDDSTRIAIERFESKWLEEFLDACEHVCEA